MRSSSLQGIRARVERLAANASVNACGGNHSLVQVSHVQDDEPAPQWPPVGAPARCECGAELQYSHVVHEYRAENAA